MLCLEGQDVENIRYFVYMYKQENKTSNKPEQKERIYRMDPIRDKLKEEVTHFSIPQLVRITCKIKDNLC